MFWRKNHTLYVKIPHPFYNEENRIPGNEYIKIKIKYKKEKNVPIGW